MFGFRATFVFRKMGLLNMFGITETILGTKFFRNITRFVSPLFKKCKRFFIHITFKRRANHDRTLARYIVRELLVYFCAMFLVFFLIFFVNQILLFMKQLLGKRVPMLDAMKLMLFSLPFVIAQSAPFATLTGFLMCLGRMASDNEILVFHASGFSLGRLLLRPILVLGIVISIFSFFVNDYLLPLGTSATRAQLRKTIASNPTMEIEANSIKRMNETTVVIGGVQDKVISDLVLFDRDSDGRQRVIVAGKTFADSGSMEGVSMRFDMNNACVAVFDRNEESNFDVMTSKLMSLNLFESTVFNFERRISPSEMTSHDLGKKIREMKKRPDADAQEINMNVLEYNKKFSLPFGSFFFAFLAMPLALIFGKVNGQTIGLVVGIFISFVYWAMMTVGIQLGMRNGMNGFILMWLPNTTVGIVSVVFYLLARRK